MSKSQKKQFFASIILLLVCIVGYVSVTHYCKAKKTEQEEESSKKAAENTTVLYEMDSIDNVSGLAYIVDGKTIVLNKEDSGKWICQEDKNKNLSSDTVNTMAKKLMYVTSSEVIKGPEDTDQYGFNNPTNKIVIMMSDNTSKTFIIGKQNEFDTSKYYLMLEGDKNVYVIDSTIPSAFTSDLDALEETTTVEETSTVETTTKARETVTTEESATTK